MLAATSAPTTKTNCRGAYPIWEDKGQEVKGEKKKYAQLLPSLSEESCSTQKKYYTYFAERLFKQSVIGDEWRIERLL